MPMSDKVLRAINKGRKKAGLKPIRRKKTSTKKGTTKGEVRKTARRAYEPKKKSKKNGIKKLSKIEHSGDWNV